MGQIQYIEEANFETATADGVVLVDFYADWCGPCRMLTPILEQLQQDMGDKVRVVKIDVDKAQSVASEYDITSIPTLILFKNGSPQGKVVGLKNLEELKKFVAV